MHVIPVNAVSRLRLRCVLRWGCVLRCAVACSCAIGLIAMPGRARCDDPSLAAPAEQPTSALDAAKAPAEGGAADGDGLSGQQARVAQQFGKFETLLLRLAEVTGPSDPRRAALLRRAVAASKEKLVQAQLDRLVELLEQDQAGLALGQQQGLVQDLQAILDVLLSEDHERQAQSERERLAAYLKEVNRLIQEQQALAVQTERAAPTDDAAARQSKLADKTGALAEKMQRESPRSPDQPHAGDEPRLESPAEAPDEKPSESPDAGAPDRESDPQQPSGERKSAGAQRPADSQQSTDPQQPSSPQQSSAESQASPPPAQTGEAPLRAAQQRMQAAEAKLRQAQRDQAQEEQAEALRELRAAKAELEKVLRQLREQELERTLVQLEERLRQLLKTEREIQTGTQRLDAIAAADRQRGDELDSGRLGRKQSLLAAEAEKARLLLEEDGTSVAFVELLQQVRDDMRQVADRLGRFDTGSLTQSIEQDIVEALEEMLAALEKAQQDQQDRRDQPQAPQQSDDQPQRLIDRLAELKLIRSLQWRVNRRTEEINKLVAGPRPDRPELLAALRELAEREQRIFHSTRELALETGR